MAFRNVISLSTSTFRGVLGETVATKTCSCDKSPGVQCYYDPSCPGLGCGAEGQAHCRFCGPKNGYAACPDKAQGCWVWVWGKQVVRVPVLKKAPFFFGKIRSCRRFEVRLMISPGPKKESELIEPHCFFEG